MSGFYNYGNVAKSTGNNNPGSCEILIAPLSYLDTIQTPDSTPTVAGDSVTISGTHTFQPGKGWIKLLGNIKTKNNSKGTTTGEQGSRNMTCETTVQVAGLNAALIEFAESGINQEFIMLIGDGCNCDNGTPSYVQHGCEKLPCHFTTEFDTGTIDGGFKGFTFKFMSYGFPKVYEGGVTLYS